MTTAQQQVWRWWGRARETLWPWEAEKVRGLANHNDQSVFWTNREENHTRWPGKEHQVRLWTSLTGVHLTSSGHTLRCRHGVSPSEICRTGGSGGYLATRWRLTAWVAGYRSTGQGAGGNRSCCRLAGWEAGRNPVNGDTGWDPVTGTTVLGLASRERVWCPGPPGHRWEPSLGRSSLTPGLVE